MAENPDQDRHAACRRLVALAQRWRGGSARSYTCTRKPTCPASVCRGVSPM